VCGEALPVDEEFVALRFAAEDRVIVDDEAAPALVFLEEDRGGESADAAADGDEVVYLAGVDGAGDARFERAVAQRVSGAQDLPGVPVRMAVVAYAAVAVEGIGGRDRWRRTGEQESGAGEEGAVEEVAAGDRLAEAEARCSYYWNSIFGRITRCAVRRPYGQFPRSCCMESPPMFPPSDRLPAPGSTRGS